jgi:hypothetical protein
MVVPLMIQGLQKKSLQYRRTGTVLTIGTIASVVFEDILYKLINIMF